ncbi:MAG: glycine zipper 2TM domain-containing protein, partial [Kiloniellales bacterium]
PVLAEAQPRHHRHHSTRDQRCKGARQRSANTGTVVGAVGGGLAGNMLGNHSMTSTLVGAGVGAVAGHQIGKHNSKCR